MRKGTGRGEGTHDSFKGRTPSFLTILCETSIAGMPGHLVRRRRDDVRSTMLIKWATKGGVGDGACQACTRTEGEER